MDIRMLLTDFKVTGWGAGDVAKFQRVEYNLFSEVYTVHIFGNDEKVSILCAYQDLNIEDTVFEGPITCVVGDYADIY